MATANISNTLVVPQESKVFPYYDDFSEDKNFHRILFRPGYAVQARELTQSQTILQNQIERFGNHIFAEGSIVSGGQSTVETVDIVTLNSEYNGTAISVPDFVGQDVLRVAGPIVTTSSLSVDDVETRARVFVADVTDSNYPILAVNYGNSGGKFDVNTTIQIEGTTTNATVAFANNNFRGTMARVEEGIFYIRGFFVRVPQQFLILSSNTSNSSIATSYRVGLELQDDIVLESDDASLLDPAQESFNYQAPGAARYRINLKLSKRELDSDFDVTKFIELLVIENGILKRVNRYPIYSELNDTLARRTYEESGNYTVDPFMLELKSNTTNANSYIASLDPGVAYVKGGRFETISSTVLNVPRALQTQNVNNYLLNMPQGNYITVTRVRGNTFFDTSVLTKADIHAVESSKVVTANSFTYNSTKVGTAIFRNMVYDGAYNQTVPDSYIYRAYILNTEFNTLTSDTLGANANTGILNRTFTSNTGASVGGINNHFFTILPGADLKIIFNSYNALNNVSIYRGGSATLGSTTERLLADSNTSPPSLARPTEAEILSHVAAGGSRYIGNNGKPPNPGESDQNRFGILRVPSLTSISTSNLSNVVIRVQVDAASNYEFSLAQTVPLIENSLVLANSAIAHRLSTVDNAYANTTLKIYAGTGTGYKGTITSYNGAGRIARVTPAFGDIYPDTTTKYSISFDEGDMRSFIIGGNTKNVYADVDSTSIFSGESYITDKDFSPLLYSLPDSPVARGSIGDQSFSYKYTFKDVAFSNTGIATISLGTLGSEFSGTTFVANGTLSDSQVLQNFTVVVKDNGGSANVANGQILAYTDTGYSVTVTGGTSAAFVGNFDATTFTSAGFKADVITTLNVSSGTQQGNKTKTYVSGNNYAFLTGSANNGPYGASQSYVYTGANRGQIYIRFPNTQSGKSDDLFISDVVKLVGVYESTTSTITAGTLFVGAGLRDVTTRYRLDNGQTETIYDHARIILKPGYTPPQGAIVVVVDYFEHTGSGYFSVDSYNASLYNTIPVYENKKTNRIYNLRDCIDFRPVRTNGTNTASDFTLTGNRIPIADSNFTLDYRYYLPRIDKIVLKPSLEFSLVSGVPAKTPVEPKTSEGDMLLYTMNVPAYTFSPKDINVAFNDNRRYTMKDIGILEKRIENLEYYSTLSLLEKKAMEKTILDNNGLDRTKYGTIVDSFTNFDVADEENNFDFGSAIRRGNGTLLPSREAIPVDFQYKERTNTNANNDIVTLRHTATVAIKQNNCSKFDFIQDFAVPYIDGTITLSPEVDIWYNIEYVPDYVVKSNTDTTTVPDSRLDDLGESRYDITSIPYMRARPLKFLGEGLKSFMKHYPFFDGIPIRNYVARANKLKVTARANTALSSWIDMNNGGGEYMVSEPPEGGNSAPLLLQDHTHFYIGPENGDEFEQFDPFDATTSTVFVSMGITKDLSERTHSYTFNKEGHVYIFYNQYKGINGIEVYQANASPAIYFANGALNVNSSLVTKLFTANSTYTDGIQPNNKEIKEYLSIPYTGSNVAPSKYIGSKGAGPELGIYDQYRFGLFEYDLTPAEGNTIIVLVGRDGEEKRNTAYQFAITQDKVKGELLKVGQKVYGSDSLAKGTITAIEHYSGSARRLKKDFPDRNTKIRLQKTASTSNNWYVGNTIYLISGKGVGESRLITAYDGTKQIATVDVAWNSVPRGNTIYSIGDLETNGDGDLPGIFFIPSNDTLKFRTGDRLFTLSDSITNDSANSESEAIGSFKSEGYTVVAETGVSLSDIVTTRPKDPMPASDPFTGLPNKFTSTIRDPLAQSFFIDSKEFPRGMFLSAIDLYFNQKAERGAVRIAIHKMENGFPSQERIAGGKAVVKSGFMNDVPIPTDFTAKNDPAVPAPVPVRFKFRGPLYLQPGEYCFIVKASGKNYQVYFADKGAKDLRTGALIAKQPYVGTMFKSSSGTTWKPFLNEDVMFGLVRCSFTKGDGTVTFESKKMMANYYYDRYMFKAKDIVPSGTTLKYQFKTTVANTSWTDITPNKLVTFDDGLDFYTRRQVGLANGSIQILASLSTDDETVSPVVDMQSIGMKVFDININAGGIYDRNIKIKNPGSSYTSAPTVTVSPPDRADGVTAAISLTINDQGTLEEFTVTEPGSGYYTTPTITLNGGGGSGGELQVITEQSPSDGNAEARYITKQITLAEGFDAGDIKVYMDICKPQGTDVKVYYKVLNSNDATLFEDRPWLLMTLQGTDLVSRDNNDFIEFEYSADDVDGRIRYSDTDSDQQFRTFRNFAIKIAMYSDQNNIWPKVKNFRAMALPGIDA